MKGFIKKQQLVFLFLVFICMSMLFGKISAVKALTEESKIVRVAYPIQKGITDIDENGNYCGYTYEYLEEIAQYTGWDYEFIRAEGSLDEQITTLMELLQEGKIDLMGAVIYSGELGEKYNYSSHSYGVAETVLQASVENGNEIVINSQIMQTIRIAVLNSTGRIIQELEDYCKMNLIEPVYVQCNTTEDQVEAIREGRADFMLNSSLNYTEGVRTIARFSPKPFYFILPKEESDGLTKELNQAILDIEQMDPYLTTTLFEKNFSSAYVKLQLTQEEREFIQRAAPIRVGIRGQQPPFQYMENKNRKLSGISIDLLNAITEKTGLKFEYIYADTSEDLNLLLKKKEIDLVAGISYQYETAREQNLAMTRPYVSAQYILVTKEQNRKENVVGKRLALPKYSLNAKKAIGEIVYFDTIEDCFEAIEKGKANYTYVDAYTAQYFINLPEYADLKLIPQTIDQRKVCFGVVKPGSRELLSIINKSIVSMPVEELQALVNQNTIVSQPHPINKVLRNIMLVLLLALLFLLVGFSAYYISTRRSEKLLKEAKEKAEDAYKKAEKANFAKSEFLSRMSHEIRTPMNGISGMTAIAIQNIEDRKKVADCLKKVQKSTKHLLMLINDILDMAKIESGKIEFHKEKFDFREFLENISSLYYGQAMEKGVSYETCIDGDVNGMLIGDSLRLSQILGNLISNACKFTPSGGIVKLYVSQILKEAETIWIQFQVSDTGCGIAPERIHTIFDSFEQGGPNTARIYGGTGLGLAIVNRFTKMMGGRVFVESILEKGSTFTVEIPFENVEQTMPTFFCQEKSNFNSVYPKGAEKKEEYNFSGCHILLAEDNELNQEIVMELIGATGAKIDCAADGTQAVALFSKAPVGYYDLILMDIQMPCMNGYEATKEIRCMNRADAAQVPIIAMTADAFAEDEEKCLAVGMNAHLSKPIEVDIIYSKLSNILKNKKRGNR